MGCVDLEERRGSLERRGVLVGRWLVRRAESSAASWVAVSWEERERLWRASSGSGASRVETREGVWMGDMVI